MRFSVRNPLSLSDDLPTGFSARDRVFGGKPAYFTCWGVTIASFVLLIATIIRGVVVR